MPHRFDYRGLSFFHVSLAHPGSVGSRWIAIATLVLGLTCKVHAQQAPPPSAPAEGVPQVADCLPSGDGFLRARLSGAIRMELTWDDEGTECTGAVRPTDGGIRMRFSRQEEAGKESAPGRLVLVFGIAKLPEGRSAKTVPVNVTVIREGQGEFYSTQGDDKCMLDEVTQQPIVGIPRRSRSYRVVARGFCTEPARAVRGQGAVLLSRFDFAGRVDFDSDDAEDDDALAAGKQ